MFLYRLSNGLTDLLVPIRMWLMAKFETPINFQYFSLKVHPIIVCFLLGNSTVDRFTYLPIEMEQTECSETSAYKIQTPENYPEESVQHTEHDEILKPRHKIIQQTLEAKTQLYFIYIYIWQTMVITNNYMFRPLTGHHQVVYLVKRGEGRAVQYSM